jgi:hypothetical protein
MLTVVGLLVYALIQRQVRLSLYDQQQSLPGNKGLTTTPTAYGVQSYRLLVCDALGIDRGWYTAPSHQGNS